MLKKRLIFTLLADKKDFMLSRNFSLQRCGNLDWLKEHYDFNSITFSIDELVVLNVERGKKDLQTYAQNLKELTSSCFIPITGGGGIRKMEEAKLLLNSGCDKLIINTLIFEDPDLVKKLAKTFGSQCIVGSLDYKSIDGRNKVICRNGQEDTGLEVKEAICLAEDLGVGELYLTSIKKDGTGQGFDLDFVKEIADKTSLPIIISGGAGNFRHFVDVLKHPDISAASTANLFNFMGDNLTEARQHIIEEGILLASWKTKEEFHNFLKN